ncbi:hypothetical protein [Thalassobacillus devorans]|uniref:hypothetical protein n=1 Tax=Thalassobacillus devorans TaxID=279813 RepID=UPI0007843BBF|nr:hypothetical protein [Thalassobacillus devorans]
MINCFRCEFFFTTWNTDFPRGCKAYGFKTREMPAEFVKKTTGTMCLQFREKQISDQPASQSSSLDFRI